MSAHSGPNIDDTGLVFSYDAYNTDKSWKGAPTTNLANEPNNIATIAASAGSIKTLNTIKLPAEVLKTSIGDMGDQIVGSGWIAWTNTGVTTGLQYMVSWYVKGYGSQNSIYWSWGGSHTGTKTTFDVSLITGAITNLTLIPGETCTVKYIENGWWRISCSTTMTDTACYPQVSYTTGVYLCGIQIEQRSFLTPFVKGTRTNTQSLLDLTGSNIVTNTEATYNNDGTFKFDGVNDYYTISTFVNKPTTAITMEVWIKPTKASVGTGTIRGGALSCTNSTYLGIIDSTDGGNTFSMHWANQTTSSRLYNVNGSIPNNAWSYLVGTYDGSISKAYLNSVEIWSSAQSGTIPDGTYVIGTYGLNIQDGLHNFNGLIDVGKIYNRALSAVEIKQHFNALRNRYGI